MRPARQSNSVFFDIDQELVPIAFPQHLGTGRSTCNLSPLKTTRRARFAQSPWDLKSHKMESQVFLGLVKTPQDQPLFFNMVQGHCEDIISINDFTLPVFKKSKPRTFWEPDLGQSRPAMNEDDLFVLFNKVEGLIEGIKSMR